MAMTKEEHKKRHLELHEKLDELLADFLLHNCRPPIRSDSKSLTTTTLMELMEWSHKQTVDPDELPE